MLHVFRHWHSHYMRSRSIIFWFAVMSLGPSEKIAHLALAFIALFYISVLLYWRMYTIYVGQSRCIVVSSWSTNLKTDVGYGFDLLNMGQKLVSTDGFNRISLRSGLIIAQNRNLATTSHLSNCKKNPKKSSWCFTNKYMLTQACSSDCCPIINFPPFHSQMSPCICRPKIWLQQEGQQHSLVWYV